MKTRQVLNLERNEEQYSDDMKGIVGRIIMTPALGSKGEYWKYRVKLSKGQAIIGFEKMGTIGIGFVKEEDWNTNLPFDCESKRIFDHIKHNKRYDSISDDDCILAIKMIQDAVVNDKPKGVSYIDKNGDRRTFE